MSDSYNNDAEASRLIIAMFSIITTLSHIIVFDALHRVSKQIPQPKQYDHNNQKQSWLLGRVYPKSYFIDTAEMEIEKNDDSQDEKEALINNDSYFGETEVTFWSKLFRHRTCSQYLVLLLQFWSLCCGIIAFYLSLVFYMNMTIEYIIVCFSKGVSFYLIALLALFFVIEIIFWSIRRQIESVQIICRNTLDMYDIRLVMVWRLFSVFSCIGFAVWVAFDDDFIPFSDILWWQFFLFFMLIHGIVFQVLYGLVAFVQSVAMVIHKLKICCGGNQTKINIFQLILVTDPNERQDNDHIRLEFAKCLQYIFLFLIYVLIAAFVASYIVYNDEIYRFAAVSAIMYYIIVVFERGKYNALYMLWTVRFQKEYFQRFLVRDFEDSKVINHKTVLSMELSEQIPNISENSKLINKKRKVHHKQNTHGTMLIKNESDLPLIEAVQYDVDELMIHTIKYRQFWNNIRYDYKRNDYFGCNKYCHCAQDWLGWFCIAIFIFAVVLISYLFLIQSDQTITESIQASNNETLSSYPICDFSLRQTNDLSVMDLTYLSIVAYNALTEQRIRQQFSVWFGDNYTQSWDINTLSIHEKPAFFHIKNNEFNFDIISIRGTMDKTDTEQTIGLYSEVATFQIFSWLLPLTDILPMGFVRQFIDVASMPEQFVAPSVRDKYDNPIYDYIKSNIIHETVSNDSYIISVGHSLGGALAQIVSARLYDNGYGINDNIVSFGIANPGSVYSSKKFGFSVESLDKTAISLLPRRDIVTMVDAHGGVVQNIECDAKHVFSCHSAQTTFCEMYHQCGHSMTRNITFARCVCVEKNDWTKCW